MVWKDCLERTGKARFTWQGSHSPKNRRTPGYSVVIDAHHEAYPAKLSTAEMKQVKPSEMEHGHGWFDLQMT